MGKIIEFKNLKVLISNYKIQTPPKYKFPNGRSLLVSFGTKGTEQYKQNYKIFDKLDSLQKEIIMNKGEIYISFNGQYLKSKKYISEKAGIDSQELQLKIPLRSTQKNEDDGTYTEKEHPYMQGIEPLILYKGEPNEKIRFPFGGDTVDIKFEITLPKTNDGYRIFLIPHEINITSIKERTELNTNNKEGFFDPELQIPDDIFAENFGDMTVKNNISNSNEQKQEAEIGIDEIGNIDGWDE